MASNDLKGYLTRWDGMSDVGKQSAYGRYKAEYEKWLRYSGRPLSEVKSRLASLPDYNTFVSNPSSYVNSFEQEAPNFVPWIGAPDQVPADFKYDKDASAANTTSTPVATPVAVVPQEEWQKRGYTSKAAWEAATAPNQLAQTGTELAGSRVDPNAGTIEKNRNNDGQGHITITYLDGRTEVIADPNYKPVDPTPGGQHVSAGDGSGKQELLNAEWGYGVGDDFAKYGPSGETPTAAGGNTWKPSYIMGQEAEKRYAMGDQFAQYLPAAFQSLTQAVPTSPNLPNWDTYNTGSKAGSFAQTGSAPGTASIQGPQSSSQQTLTQGAGFTPYNESTPYSYSNWTRPQTQKLDPNTGQPIQSTQAVTQQTPANTTLGTTGTKLKQGNDSNTSLAAVGTQPQNANYGILSNASGGYGIQQQQTPSYQGYSTPDYSGVSKQKQDTTTNPLTSLFNVSQGQGTLQNAANYYGGQTESVQNPSVDTSAKNRYVNTYNTNANNTAGSIYGLNQTATPATNPAAYTNAAMQNSILGQVNKTTGDTGLGGLMPTIQTAIQSALAPKDQYNKELNDKLYADATRRIDEDTNRQIENIRKQYNAYGLGGSSSEAEALRVLNDAAAEKKLTAQRNVDTQTLQNAQQYSNTQLTQLANILGTVGGQQNATTSLGLDLLGKQQTGYDLNQQDLSRQSDVYNALAQYGLQNTNQAAGLEQWGAEQNFAGTQAAANTGLQKASQGYQMQQGADTSAQNWNAANQKAQQATLAGNLELANYWDQVAQTELANAQQAYTNKTNEAMTNYQAQQANYQNLQNLLGTATGLYSTFGTTGYDQMGANLENIAALAQGWNQRSAQKTAENSWWQPLLGATAKVGAAAVA